MFNINEKMEILTEEQEKERRDLVCPIVFLDKKTSLTNSTPISESMNMAHNYLDYQITDNQALKMNDRDLFIDLSYISLQNTTFNITNKIINDSLKSVFSALEQSYIIKTHILDFVPLFNSIRNCLTNEEFYKELSGNIQSFYRSIAIESKRNKIELYIYCTTKECETYCAQIANNLFLSIISRINFAIETSVDVTVDKFIDSESVIDKNYNDSIVERFKSIIIDTFKGIDKNSKGHFWLYSKYAISKAIYDEVSVCYSAILNNINLTITNTDTLAYTLLYDAMFVSDCIKNSKNKLKNKQLDF